jgi:ABC-type multidrug transport system ATPase subunit
MRRKGAETMSALAARGIRKSFRRRQVLAGVDLEVAAGELVAVVGENGTGKTTLLRILAGDLRPDAGSVAIGGRPGYCPQTVVLDEALTVDQNVRYFQAAYGTGRTDRAGELIGRLGYAACRGQRVGTLSGGTKQKLSLTRRSCSSTSPTRVSTGRPISPSGSSPASCAKGAPRPWSSATWSSSRSGSTGSAT